MIRPYSPSDPSRSHETSALWRDAAGRSHHVIVNHCSAFAELHLVQTYLEDATNKTRAINACRPSFGDQPLKGLIALRRKRARQAICYMHRALFAARLGLLC